MPPFLFPSDLPHCAIRRILLNKRLLHRLVEILLTLLWHPAAKPMPNRAGSPVIGSPLSIQIVGFRPGLSGSR